jgi:photosystem II stability/assembly factor-like uncharacterized protein
MNGGTGKEMRPEGGDERGAGMSEDDAVDQLARIDQAIDEIVARRSAAGQQAGPVPQPRTADEALVTELAALGALDWPADEVGTRVARGVARALAPAGAAVSQAEPEGAAEPEGPAEPREMAEPGVPAGPRHPRRDRASRGRRRWPVFVTPLAAAAAVLAVVAGVLTITSGHSGRTAGPSPGSTAPFASPFRYLGTAEVPGQLDCVTASVCDALIFQQASYPPLAIADRTTDGGLTWQRLATVPNTSIGARTFPTFVIPSCPTATDCFVATVQGLAVTTDGGASWRTEPTPGWPGAVNPYIDSVSCATAEDCVIHVTDSAVVPTGRFFSTTDGGRNWTMATPLPGNALSSIGYLRCDPDGDCIGLGSVLNANSVVQGFQAVSSADNGVTWTLRPPFLQTAQQPVAPDSQLPLSMGDESCGDALHCIVVNGAGIAVTSDGGATWRQVALTGDYLSSDLLVSCATGLDCVLASGPLIATTVNGLTWTPKPAPTAGGSPLVGFVDLSCPSTAGCVAVGVTRQQLDAAGNSSVMQGSVISSLPRSR